ncbi:nuclear pore complex protein Nup155-like isoform X2 [Halichondria panicea]
MVAIEGTPDGRLFLAGRDGCLYEIIYQAVDGWFSKKCRKINHSISMVSFLVPSFLSFSEDDPLTQLVIDNSRHVLYTRSDNNTITAYDLGSDGKGLRRVASISMGRIVQRSLSALRSADKTLVSPLVWISVIPASESLTLHLLAVTKSGLRLYFTTTPGGIAARPSLLALVHVRLPPGYSPSSTQRPGPTVHQVFYRKGVLVLSSSVTEERDNLWMVDSDLFPFQTALMESHVTNRLEGRMWAIAESIQPGELEAISSPTPSPPTLVTQHARPSRQFVLLTTQGSYIVTKLRPMEQLQFLLDACKSGTSESIESFFTLFKETQACAMCLILATKSSPQVSASATEAFFRYGGEPHFIFPTNLGPAGLSQGGVASPMQTPPPSNIASTYQTTPQTLTPQQGPGGGPGTPAQYGTQTPGTPAMGMGPQALGRALTGPEVHLSGRHDGLVRYLSRLLRPLWNEPVAVSYKPPGDIQNEQVESRYSREELTIFSEQLHNLKSFLETNRQLFSMSSDSLRMSSPSNVHQRMLHFMRPDGMDTVSPAHVQQSLMKKYQADAHQMEQSSLLNLHALIVRCCECLSLWKLFTENQFSLVAAGLSKDNLMLLQRTTFSSLFVRGKQLISSLITSLLTRHAVDSAMSDTLTVQLRGSTPSLFSQDDAVLSKGLELVTMAKASQSNYDRLTQLRESLKNFSRVTHQLPLATIVELYSELHFMEGVVELALCSANHKDPQNLGLHFYKSGQPPDDVMGQRAFMERQELYSTVTGVLSQLLLRQRTPGPAQHIPTRPGPPPDKPTEDHPDPQKEFDETISIALRSDDQLFHVTLYSWLIGEDLADMVVEIQSPYIEEYLKYTATIQDDNRLILDLLWRYYERNKNYAAAAQILDKIAHTEGSDLELDERLEYISRAVMCAKSCNLATSASRAGEILHELEEKMEVARIQLGVLDALNLRPRTPDVAAAIGMLNEELMDITKLYGDFAEPFELAECKLAIVHCAGHYDPTLIESLWRDIIDSVLRVGPPTAPAQMQAIRTKLMQLGPLYSASERFFPLRYLVVSLEKHACQRGWERGFPHQLLLEIGVSLKSLFLVYDEMYKAKDAYWASVGSPLYVLVAMASVVDSYLQRPSMVTIYEKPTFTASVQDALNRYLVELGTLSPSTPHYREISSKLRDQQTRLQRMTL